MSFSRGAMSDAVSRAVDEARANLAERVAPRASQPTRNVRPSDAALLAQYDALALQGNTAAAARAHAIRQKFRQAEVAAP
jgi:hypothetical protein